MEMKAIASAQSIKAENKCYIVLQQAGICNRKIQTFIAMFCAGSSIPKKARPTEGDSHRRADITRHLTELY